MPKIKELFELARQSYALANGTFDPETKKTLQNIGAKYVQQAEGLRSIAITRAEYPKDNK